MSGGNCGTERGMQSHKSKNEPPCVYCIKAMTAPAKVPVARGRSPYTGERAKCGTPSGYKRHRKNGEEACERCKQAARDYKRGNHVPAPPRPIAACGTATGYQRHMRVKEASCKPCRDAYNQDARDRRARRKATQ